MFLEALRRLGVERRPRPPGVEDSHNGILAARAAGLRVIAVPNAEFPPGPDALAAADVVLAAARRAHARRSSSRLIPGRRGGPCVPAPPVASQRRGGSTRTNLPRFSIAAIVHARSICACVYRVGLWSVSM